MSIQKQILKKVTGFWNYVRELEDYKWERGSSCCLPDPKSLDENPFHFDEKETHPTHHHHEHRVEHSRN